MPQEATIPLDKLATVEELHVLLANVFGFPHYYGRNWDAFWDCINEFSEDAYSKITFTGWDDFTSIHTGEARHLLRCLIEWVSQMDEASRPSLFIETGQRQVEMPDIISTPLYSRMVTKDILYSSSFLRRGVIALREDMNYEVRIEIWQYFDDPISYPSCYGYWSEIGKPSHTDTLDLARSISSSQGCNLTGLTPKVAFGEARTR